MAERKTGLAPLPASLLRPTSTPPEPLEPATSEEPAEVASLEGRGVGQAEARTPRARRRRPPEGETRGRKLHLPDGVHDRLWQLARQRRQSVSAVAAEILDRNLPRYRVEREG